MHPRTRVVEPEDRLGPAAERRLDPQVAAPREAPIERALELGRVGNSDRTCSTLAAASRYPPPDRRLSADAVASQARTDLRRDAVSSAAFQFRITTAGFIVGTTSRTAPRAWCSYLYSGIDIPHAHRRPGGSHGPGRSEALACGPGTTVSARWASTGLPRGAPRPGGAAQRRPRGRGRPADAAWRGAPPPRWPGARPFASRGAAPCPLTPSPQPPVKDRHLMALVARALSALDRVPLPRALQRRRLLQLPHQGALPPRPGHRHGARPRADPTGRVHRAAAGSAT